MIYLLCTTGALFLGFLLDLLLGDPQGMWHPIIAIGHLIAGAERFLRWIFRVPYGKSGREPVDDHGQLAASGNQRDSREWERRQSGNRDAREFLAGICLVALVALISTGVPLALVLAAYWIHWGLGLGVETILCYFILATKSLKTESMKVAEALSQGGLERGRQAVAMIVGRDTRHLTQDGVVRAAVETVAENASDGVIAPMLFMAIGGPVAGFFYKSINTMDSMVGYKNERYLYFGRAAAKADDVVNYIPARLSAMLMLLASVLPCLPKRRGTHRENVSRTQWRFSSKDALRVYRRDRRKHASPNSAQTEAVMAGALRVQLAGPAWYFGKKLEKPTIGDDLRPIENQDIARANRLLYKTAWLGMLLFLGLKCLTFFIL